MKANSYKYSKVKEPLLAKAVFFDASYFPSFLFFVLKFLYRRVLSSEFKGFLAVSEEISFDTFCLISSFGSSEDKEALKDFRAVYLYLGMGALKKEHKRLSASGQIILATNVDLMVRRISAEYQFLTKEAQVLLAGAETDFICIKNLARNPCLLQEAAVLLLERFSGNSEIIASLFGNKNSDSFFLDFHFEHILTNVCEVQCLQAALLYFEDALFKRDRAFIVNNKVFTIFKLLTPPKEIDPHLWDCLIRNCQQPLSSFINSLKVL